MKKLNRSNSSPVANTPDTHKSEGPLRNEVHRSTSYTSKITDSLNKVNIHRSPNNTIINGRSPGSTSQRLAALDSTYSPVRTPSGSSRLSGKPRSSSGTSKLPQPIHYTNQEKSYLKKIKNDIADDYYTKAIT